MLVYYLIPHCCAILANNIILTLQSRKRLNAGRNLGVFSYDSGHIHP
jgi:hypothetical protein